MQLEKEIILKRESPFPINQNGGFDIGFLGGQWDLKDGCININIRVGFQGLSTNLKALLSVQHPKIVLQTPNILGTYVEVHLEYNDNTGNLYVKGIAHFWAFGYQQQSVAISLNILPPYILGLLGIGAQLPGIIDFAPQIKATNLNFDTAFAIRNQIELKCLQEKVSTESIYNIYKQLPELGNKLATYGRTDKNTLEQIIALNINDLEKGLCAVVNDPRIKKVYPGIDKKFQFSNEALTESSKYLASLTLSNDEIKEFNESSTLQKILNTISEILGTVGALSVIAGTTLSILSGIFLALMGLTAGCGAFVFTAISGIIALLLFFSACVMFGVAIITLVFKLIVDLVLVWISDTENRVDVLENYQDLLATTN